MNILAIGGSNSSNSINKTLAHYTAHLFPNAHITKIDINNIPVPIYSTDQETQSGIPQNILQFAHQIDNTNLIIISLAENNGSFNVGIKNILDWTSRIKDRKIFNNKPMLLMATSPGPRGGLTVLENAKNLFPHLGANIKATFSLPNFHQNFHPQQGITNPQYLSQLKDLISTIVI